MKRFWNERFKSALSKSHKVSTYICRLNLDFTDYITFISWQHLVMHCIIHVRSSVLRSGQVYIAFIQKAMPVQFLIKNTYFNFFYYRISLDLWWYLIFVQQVKLSLPSFCEGWGLGIEITWSNQISSHI